jgi:hypothetical protein
MPDGTRPGDKCSNLSTESDCLYIDHKIDKGVPVFKSVSFDELMGMFGLRPGHHRQQNTEANDRASGLGSEISFNGLGETLISRSKKRSTFLELQAERTERKDIVVIFYIHSS